MTEAADATLTGTITSVYIAPLTFDSATGRVSTSLVAVSMNSKLVDKDGKILWSNPNFQFPRAVPGVDRPLQLL